MRMTWVHVTDNNGPDDNHDYWAADIIDDDGFADDDHGFVTGISADGTWFLDQHTGPVGRGYPSMHAAVLAAEAHIGYTYDVHSARIPISNAAH